MRLLHVVHQYPPEHMGGTEIYTRTLAYGLANRGHQVAVFHRRDGEGVGHACRTEGEVQVWSAWNGLPGPTRRFLATFGDGPILQAFQHVLEETRPALVHIQHLMGLPAAVFDVLRRSGVPFVVTLWDFWWFCANAQLLTNFSQEVCEGPRAFINCAHCVVARAGHPELRLASPVLAGPLAWRNQLLRRGLQAARRLIAPTEFVRRLYVEHGAPAEGLVTLAPGTEYPPPELCRAERPAGAPLRFVYVGGLSWQKGIHVVVEAFEGVRGAVELWIAGDESFDPDYTAKLRALAGPRVRFLGKLSRAAVWETLSQADAVVVSSLWYETFSFIVHEAFAAGIPVVASNLGVMADRVRDGVDGLLVPPGDVPGWRSALQGLVDAPARLTQFRAGIQPPLTVGQHLDDIETLYTRSTVRTCLAPPEA
ncbi:MAG TPA: glycosyltransferase family 4 protein [Ardenticatenaceae bacterium]|nr:glycosyltransferase family 4 protein [Ardenticatenaceae bacterium]